MGGIGGVAALALSLVASVAGAQQTVPQLRAATVRTVVSGPDDEGVFSYEYTTENPGENDHAISVLEVDVSRGAETAALSSQGLEIDRGRSQQSFQAAAADLGIDLQTIVPIGCAVASDWICLLNVRGTVTMFTPEDAARAPVGGSRSGLVLRSRGGPRIGSGSVEPDYVYVADGSITEEDRELAKKANEEVKFPVTLVAPEAPPLEPTKEELCRALLDSLERSTALGWVRSPDVANALREKVEAMKSALARGQRRAALGSGRAFLRQVEGAACEEIHCPGKQPIQAEAHAVLEHRMRRLLDTIGADAPAQGKP